MTVEEALEFFKNIPRIHKKIETLYDVVLVISNWDSRPPLCPEARLRGKTCHRAFEKEHWKNNVYTG